MNKLLTILIIGAFLSVPIFGFAIMHHGEDHNDCMVTTANKVDCPAMADYFSLALVHLDVIKFFSLAIFEINVLSFSLFIGWLMIFMAGIGFLGREHPLSAGQSHFLKYRTVHIRFNSESLYWFSLHENSPSTL